MEIQDFPVADWVKVGRLKHGEGDFIHLFVDRAGELVMITRQEAERLVDEVGEMVVVARVDGVEHWCLCGSLGICWRNGRGRRRRVSRGLNIHP